MEEPPHTPRYSWTIKVIIWRIVYLWKGGGAEENNKKLINHILKDIKELAQNNEIMITGDMNGHIEDFDGYASTARRYNYETHGPMLANSAIKHEGKPRWKSRNSWQQLANALCYKIFMLD